MNIDEFISKMKVMFEFEEAKLREEMSGVSPDELDRKYQEATEWAYHVLNFGVIKL
jgi:Mor family transcriptional regulator